MPALLRLARPLRLATLRQTPRLALARPYATKFPGNAPAPPRLPEQEQAEFEALIREAQERAARDVARGAGAADPFFENEKPEFTGDVNPKTGEAGGPKNEPLKWGSKGDWSFNGKVTDF